MDNQSYQFRRRLTKKVMSLLLGVVSFSAAGQASNLVSPYIINGQPATTATYPYIGLLTLNRLSETEHELISFCSGSLVSERYVITAAHCVYTETPSDLKDLEVVFNVDEVSSDIFKAENAFAAEKVYYHQEYQLNNALDNDIAVIQLVEPVPESIVASSDYIVNVTNENYRNDEESFTVIGYGKTKPTAQKGSGSLQEVNVTYASKESCSGVFKDLTITDKQICVTGVIENNLQSGVCGGDSGGPLLYEDKGKLYQAGIVSFGPTMCGDPGVKIQSVYTATYHYSDWLASVLNGQAVAQYDLTELEDSTQTEPDTSNSDGNSEGGGSLHYLWLLLLTCLGLRRYKVSNLK